MAAYQWKTASYIKANADEAGKMCEELENTVGLTAETLLQANTAEDTPLHNEFEWNDTKAAHSYRLQQARHIINCLVVVPEHQAENTVPVRAFFTLSSSPEYQSINAILSVEDSHKKLLEQAYRELETFKRKYTALSELKPLFDMVDKLT